MDDELRAMLVKLMEGQESIKLDITEVKTDVKKLGITMDEEIRSKIGALFDGYDAHTEKLDELGSKIDDMSITINNLSIKTASTDNKIIELNRKINLK